MWSRKILTSNFWPGHTCHTHMCTQLYTHLHTQTRTHMNIYTNRHVVGKEQPWCHPPVIFESGFLTCRILVAGRQDREFQRSVCLCFLTAGTISIYCLDWLFKMQLLEVKLRLHACPGRHTMNRAISQSCFCFPQLCILGQSTHPFVSSFSLPFFLSATVWIFTVFYTHGLKAWSQPGTPEVA